MAVPATTSLSLVHRLLGADARFRRFVVLLAIATALPMVAIPLLSDGSGDPIRFLTFAGLLTFLGGPAHVSLTSWFYTDPVARDYFLKRPIRYFVAPFFLIAGTTFAYWYWREGEPTRWINFGFSIWLLWHYQRQNWGVHSFVTRVASGGSASVLEESILRIAVVGGIIGGIKSAGFGVGTPVEAYADTAFQAGTAITITLPIMIVAALATVPSLRAAPLRIGSLLMGASFFLPVFVYDDPTSAVLTYALAHGLQYWVFMGYVARSTSLPSATPSSTSEMMRPGVWTLLAGVVVIGFLLSEGGDFGLMQKWNLLPVFGFTLGATMAHFVIDAGIWRLRDEFPRRYVGAAFPFLPRKSG
jgi:hypothetical protein